MRANQVVILSEGEALGGEGELPGVYKYQSADAIIREVMACYCTRTAEPASSQVGSKSILIGVYSPINRCLKTSFSLVLGQVLAKDQQVLYLSLEDCSGLSKIMGQSGPGGFFGCAVLLQPGRLKLGQVKILGLQLGSPGLYYACPLSRGLMPGYGRGDGGFAGKAGGETDL